MPILHGFHIPVHGVFKVWKPWDSMLLNHFFKPIKWEKMLIQIGIKVVVGKGEGKGPSGWMA